MNWQDVLKKLSVPRPNHSESLDQVASYLQELLSSMAVPFEVQHFALRPYLAPLVGVTCFALALAAFWLLSKQKGWWALAASLILPLLLLCEFEYMTPVVSGLISRDGSNIVMSFSEGAPTRELVFTAHYDSKTDLLDHFQRAWVLDCLIYALAIAPLLALLSVVQVRWLATARWSLNAIKAGGFALALYWGVFTTVFGGGVFLSEQSPGASDNAGSVVALLALAKDLQEKRVETKGTKVTIVLTSGEEVGLQGAKAFTEQYFGSAAPKLPTELINLECIGQSGDLFYLEKSGMFLRQYASDRKLVQKVAEGWQRFSTRQPLALPTSPTDAVPFMELGIPALTVGHTGGSNLGLRALHSIEDNIQRMNMENLMLAVDVLKSLIASSESNS